MYTSLISNQLSFLPYNLIIILVQIRMIYPSKANGKQNRNENYKLADVLKGFVKSTSKYLIKSNKNLNRFKAVDSKRSIVYFLL